MHGVNIYVAKDFRENKFLSLQARMNSVQQISRLKRDLDRFTLSSRQIIKQVLLNAEVMVKEKKDNSKPKDVLLD